jgi:hypothetical protein
MDSIGKFLGNSEQWKSTAAKLASMAGMFLVSMGLIKSDRWVILSANIDLTIGALFSIASIAYGWWKNTRPNLIAAVAQSQPDIVVATPTKAEADKIPLSNVVSITEVKK